MCMTRKKFFQLSLSHLTPFFNTSHKCVYIYIYILNTYIERVNLVTFTKLRSYSFYARNYYKIILKLDGLNL